MSVNPAVLESLIELKEEMAAGLQSWCHCEPAAAEDTPQPSEPFGEQVVDSLNQLQEEMSTGLASLRSSLSLTPKAPATTAKKRDPVQPWMPRAHPSNQPPGHRGITSDAPDQSDETAARGNTYSYVPRPSKPIPRARLAQYLRRQGD